MLTPKQEKAELYRLLNVRSFEFAADTIAFGNWASGYLLPLYYKQ